MHSVPSFTKTIWLFHLNAVFIVLFIQGLLICLALGSPKNKRLSGHTDS